MGTINDIPEIQGLDRRDQLIRIPPEWDVPLTARVRQIIDTAEFRRLAHVSQLGLVALVYPGTHHTRLEHSLGVYRLALLYLKQLSYDPRFSEIVSCRDAERFIAAALLHDLGHWPFCHPIEDMNLPGVPRHELFAQRFLLDSPIADTLRTEWEIGPEEVITLLAQEPQETKSRLLASMLSGPIDVDKMDYLMRDSLHAGVPYGRNYDEQRLIGSLCVNEAGDGLAISDKGRTAAEMLVFSRYVMFSEVYWHHTVRSATAMLQRAFYLVREQLDFEQLFRLNENELVASLLSTARESVARDLLEGLFGRTRRLYKRFAQFSAIEDMKQHRDLARRPYPWLIMCAENLAELLGHYLRETIQPHEVLFDAPPLKREVQCNIEIHFPKEGQYRLLSDVSPVVHTLAQQQFDNFVKRVRVFVHPRLARSVSPLRDRDALILEAIEMTKANWHE